MSDIVPKKEQLLAVRDFDAEQLTHLPTEAEEYNRTTRELYEEHETTREMDLRDHKIGSAYDQSLSHDDSRNKYSKGILDKHIEVKSEELLDSYNDHASLDSVHSYVQGYVDGYVQGSYNHRSSANDTRAGSAALLDNHNTHMNANSFNSHPEGHADFFAQADSAEQIDHDCDDIYPEGPLDKCFDTGSAGLSNSDNTPASPYFLKRKRRVHAADYVQASSAETSNDHNASNNPYPFHSYPQAQPDQYHPASSADQFQAYHTFKSSMAPIANSPPHTHHHETATDLVYKQAIQTQTSSWELTDEFDPLWMQKKGITMASFPKFTTKMKFDSLFVQGAFKLGDRLVITTDYDDHGERTEAEVCFQYTALKKHIRHPSNRSGSSYPSFAITCARFPVLNGRLDACIGTNQIIERLRTMGFLGTKLTGFKVAKELAVWRGDAFLGSYHDFKHAYHLWVEIQDAVAERSGVKWRQRREPGKSVRWMRD